MKVKSEDLRMVVLDGVPVVEYCPLNQASDDQAKFLAAVAILAAYPHAVLMDGRGNRHADVEAKMRQLHARWQAEAAA